MSILIKRSPFNYFVLSRKVSDPFNIGSIKNALLLLGEKNLCLSKPKQLAVAIFFSRMVKVPEVKEVDYSINDKTLVIFAYIEEPNWEAEEKIYECFGLILDLFPNLDIDLKVLELYGRNVEDLKLNKF